MAHRKHRNQRGISNPTVIIGLLVVIVGAAVAFISFGKQDHNANDSQETQQITQLPPDSQTQPTDPAPVDPAPPEPAKPTITVADKPVELSGALIAGTTSPLVEYNQHDLDLALSTDKKVLLYFDTNWDPICKQEVSDSLTPAFDEYTGGDVVGFRVHMNDDETTDDMKALAQKYNVSYQHTKVVLNKGTVLSTTPDAWTKDQYLTIFKTALSN